MLRCARGKTSNTRLMYDYASRDKREGDDDDDEEEVEDLYTLLKYMRQLYPEVTAVSCGAILSITYQRTRFEHVCSRLSLIPLAFRWRRAPQSSLLREMLQLNQNKDHIHNHPPNATPMQAIVVKTASMGLSSRRLNRTLLDLLPHLQTIESKYGLHVGGEGGEYESLVLDCTIYRKRLILDHYMDPSTAPAYLKII
jgi:diphthine-ammonia ligase